IPMVTTNGKLHLLRAIKKVRLIGAGRNAGPSNHTSQITVNHEPVVSTAGSGNMDIRYKDGMEAASASVPPAKVEPPRSNGIADPRSILRPFHETLRDRLITYFEVRNLTHKPKLVALTSCADGSGVSTTAAGLAASLSETGDGNVLLVDMNSQQGEAHHFYKG